MPQAQQTDRSAEFLPKTFYFFYYAAMASLFPFLALHYEQIGLDKQQIGLLASLPPILVLLGGSLWGAMADATRRHKLAMASAIAGAILFSQILATTVHFLWLIPVVLAFAFFQSPIVPLADNSVMEILGERRERYGKVRLWGAVGWGASAPLIGQLVERFDLIWSFHGYSLLMLGCLLITLRLPVAHASIGSPFRSGLKTLLADRRWLLFLFLVFAGGVGMSFAHHFLFLFMDSLGASRSLMGWSLTVATGSEMIVFFFTDRWLRRWGVRPLLIVAMLSSVLRLLAYSFADAPWQILVIQLLHGPSFALMWTAGVSYVSRLAPQGLGATAQGLFAGVNFGLAGAVGALIGGSLYQHIGPLAMYRWAGIGVLTGLLIFILLDRLSTTTASSNP